MSIRNKGISYAVRFANACNNGKLSPLSASQLVELVIRAHAVGTRYANGHTSSAKLDRAKDRVETHAATMGLRTSWPGLYPSFSGPDGHEISIPLPG